MRMLIAGSIALLALAATPAVAADMSVRAPASKEPPFPVYNWTGFYVGIQGGGAWSRVAQTDSRPFTSDEYTPGGDGVIGGTVGFNAQFDRAVLGLEADGSAAWVKGYTIGTDVLSGNCGGSPPRCFSKLQSFWTVRARAGIAMDNVLPYITGGLAVGSLHGEDGDGPANGAFGAGTKTVAGWTAGLGVEAMFNQRWSLKSEWLYIDFGNHVIFNDNVGGVIFPESLRYRAQVFRVGANYRFGY
jgi:outer membrane immunogenic protein